MKCELRDIPIHYELRGEGRPIIMLHGWSGHLRQMVFTMEPAFTGRPGWKRVYLDLPGHGSTPARDWITGQDQILDVLLDFIDAVIPGQRFAVAAASAGALLGRGVVYRRAERMDGLLLVVPTIIAADADRQVPPRTYLAQDPALMAELTPEEAETFSSYGVVLSRRFIDMLRAFVPSKEEAGDPEFQSAIRMNPVRFGLSFDVDALPEPFPAPTLMVTGRQDSIVGYRQAWDVLENYPRATFAVLDRAGHSLEADAEELWTALVRDWLDRVEEYAPSTPPCRARRLSEPGGRRT